MKKSYPFAIAAAGLLIQLTAQALEETSAHSILKHELMDTIVYREKVNRVVDLFGGAIVYRNGGVTEIGTAGRTIMNGHVADYFINDILYKKTAGTSCTFSGLPDQQQAVKVHITAEEFLKTDKAFAYEVLAYLKSLFPPLKSGETQIVIIDPYFYIYDSAVTSLLNANLANTKFLIYSPRNRATENRVEACHNILVYSETDSNYTILKNRPKPPQSPQPLTYTLVGCGFTNWNAAVNDALNQFKGWIQVDTTGVKIRTDCKPHDFHKYLPGAEKIEKCLTAGEAEEKKQ